MNTTRLVLLGAAVVFAFYVLARAGVGRVLVRAGRRMMGRGARPPEMPPETRASLARAREAARSAETPARRMAALLAAAEEARRDPPLAAAYLLRAMNADATSPVPYERAVALLGKKRPRLVARLVERRLARLSWHGPEARATRAAAHALAQLYARGRTRDLARVALAQRIEREAS